LDAGSRGQSLVSDLETVSANHARRLGRGLQTNRGRAAKEGAMIQAKPVLVEISPGELFDKITVLEVKMQRIFDAVKLRHIRNELLVLERARRESVAPCQALDLLVADLRRVNGELYDIIDRIYDYDKA